jgi:hypothetical protein
LRLRAPPDAAQRERALASCIYIHIRSEESVSERGPVKRLRSIACFPFRQLLGAWPPAPLPLAPNQSILDLTNELSRLGTRTQLRRDFPAQTTRRKRSGFFPELDGKLVCSEEISVAQMMCFSEKLRIESLLRSWQRFKIGNEFCGYSFARTIWIE